MKEQKQSQELNKIKANKIPDAEFKTMIIWMIYDLRKRMDGIRDNWKQE